jgi:AraC-like DNA-binding protein
MDRVWELLGLEAGQPPPMVTTETFFAFWRAVEEVTDRRDIGLVIGAESGRHGYSIATATALYAATLGEALETVARYKRIACPEDVDVEIARGEVSIRFHWILATTEAPRLLVDSAFASFASLARTGTDGKAAPARVELARRRADAALLRTHFECPIAFGATVDRLIFHRSALATPFVTADVEAFSRVVPGLEAELVGRSRTRSLRDDVRVAIARNMSRGRPSVEVVARRLHLSPRTLQRRLGDERTTYQQQLDQVRRTSARRLLANTELDTVDIAFLLGFEEPNSFARAFRSWERTTPVRWRERASRA